MFFCILSKLSDYGLFFLLQEHDGHFVFLICGCFGLSCPREWPWGKGKFFSLYLDGLWWIVAGLC